MLTLSHLCQQEGLLVFKNFGQFRKPKMVSHYFNLYFSDFLVDFLIFTDRFLYSYFLCFYNSTF